MPHQFQTRPLFGDVDAMGVVYYGNYLRFFELGRCELMREAGRPYADLAAVGLHLPVTETGLRYRRPARYDQLITIETRVAWVKRASLRFDYRILDQEQEGAPVDLVEGFTVHGCVDLEGRVRPLPEWLRQAADASRQDTENASE